MITHPMVDSAQLDKLLFKNTILIENKRKIYQTKISSYDKQIAKLVDILEKKKTKLNICTYVCLDYSDSDKDEQEICIKEKIKLILLKKEQVEQKLVFLDNIEKDLQSIQGQTSQTINSFFKSLEKSTDKQNNYAPFCQIQFAAKTKSQSSNIEQREEIQKQNINLTNSTFIKDSEKSANKEISKAILCQSQQTINKNITMIDTQQQCNFFEKNVDFKTLDINLRTKRERAVSLDKLIFAEDYHNVKTKKYKNVRIQSFLNKTRNKSESFEKQKTCYSIQLSNFCNMNHLTQLQETLSSIGKMIIGDQKVYKKALKFFSCHLCSIKNILFEIENYVINKYKSRQKQIYKEKPNLVKTRKQNLNQKNRQIEQLQNKIDSINDGINEVLSIFQNINMIFSFDESQKVEKYQVQSNEQIKQIRCDTSDTLLKLKINILKLKQKIISHQSRIIKIENLGNQIIKKQQNLRILDEKQGNFYKIIDEKQKQKQCIEKMILSLKIKKQQYQDIVQKKSYIIKSLEQKYQKLRENIKFEGKKIDDLVCKRSKQQKQNLQIEKNIQGKRKEFQNLKAEIKKQTKQKQIAFKQVEEQMNEKRKQLQDIKNTIQRNHELNNLVLQKIKKNEDKYLKKQKKILILKESIKNLEEKEREKKKQVQIKEKDLSQIIDKLSKSQEQLKLKSDILEKTIQKILSSQIKLSKLDFQFLECNKKYQKQKEQLLEICKMQKQYQSAMIQLLNQKQQLLSFVTQKHQELQKIQFKIHKLTQRACLLHKTESQKYSQVNQINSELQLLKQKQNNLKENINKEENKVKGILSQIQICNHEHENVLDRINQLKKIQQKLLIIVAIMNELVITKINRDDQNNLCLNTENLLIQLGQEKLNILKLNILPLHVRCQIQELITNVEHIQQMLEKLKQQKKQIRKLKLQNQQLKKHQQIKFQTEIEY